MPKDSRSFEDQLKEHFKAGKEERKDQAQEDINKSLEKDFQAWLQADEEKSSKDDGRVSSALRKNRDRYSKEEKAVKPVQAPTPGILVGMESRRIYEQLSLKQKKEIAWLLREEGLV